MITKERLDEVNKAMETIAIEKGKKVTTYVMVNERVKAFRALCPNGSITSHIIQIGDGVVTIMAEVKDEEGKVIASGLAQEKESASFINKTSYIENCETSAVGRALGFAGIGIDGSMASAEEVANAIINQNKDQRKSEKIARQTIDEVKVESLLKKCFNDSVNGEKLCKLYKVENFSQLSEVQFSNIIKNWEAIIKSCHS